MRPDYHHHAAIQKADRDQTDLAVVLPIVLDGQGGTTEDFGSSGHVQSALCKGIVALGGWVFNVHNLCYYNKYIKTQACHEAKNLSNQRKHDGLSFEVAARVFLDPLRLSVQDEIEDGEQRWQTLGQVGGVTVLLVAHTFMEPSMK